jgi:geranylgeranyl diphosphate synthase type I
LEPKTANPSQLAFPRLDAVRQRVDEELKKIIEAKRAQATELDPRYGRLWESIQTQMFAGGKRLRPYLAVAAYEGLGGRNPEIYKVAASQELLHGALLVHDDVMDKDYVRHGQPNVAGSYLEHYSTVPGVTHLADSAAILAGDVLLSAAHEVLYSAQFESSLLTRASQYFSTAVFEVAGGQLLDMEAMMDAPTQALSLKVAQLKTASYSFVGPMVVGAALAGATQSVMARIRAFGNSTGVAFQLADDLLGLYGSPDITGKPVISDMREGKATYLMSLAFKRATPKDRAWLETHWGNPETTQDEVALARAVVERSGAKAEVEEVLKNYASTSKQLLQAIDFEPGTTAALDELVTASIWRKV